MSFPLVSIIIPCYRQAHYLTRTLQSALAQSYANIEVIVVNDGSDDDTEKVVAGFNGQVAYIRQKNAGLPAARNTGIRSAKGKYLLFLDSDDLLHPDAVQWLVQSVNNQDEVLCAMGSRFFENENDLETGFERMPPKPNALATALMRGNPGPPHSYMCSRATMLRIGGFDSSLKSCEDWDAWARLLFAGVSVATVNQIGAYYRQHASSMSRNALRMAETATEVVKRNLQRLAENPQTLVRLGGNPIEARRAAKQRLAEEYFNAGYYLRRQNELGRAAGNYLNAIRAGGGTKPLLGLLKLLPCLIQRELSRFYNSTNRRDPLGKAT